ncbi:MAG TPA: hypothetical protein VJ843_05090 [Candidatus Saccharimonadales bacterium]|nr:hypothetical protein [Candidatus Saccharimonadales bacterium]
MNHSMNYLLDVMLFGISLFLIVYILYGRKKNQSLIGGYKPGVPGYEVFQKLIRTRVLVLVCAATVFFGVGITLDIFSILHSDKTSHSILIAAPIAVIVAVAVTFIVLPPLFRKK